MAYTTIDNPELYFQTDLFTGNATDNTAYTLDGSENMQPDWVWIKNRTDTEQHRLMDVVRGASKVIKSSGTGAEEDVSNHLKSFDTNGFTLGIDNAVNGNGDSMVAWCWKAGGSASSNSNGSITSSVSANTTAGFSIVSYTGTSANATVGHGLGIAPSLMIIKARQDANSEAQHWIVYHQSLGNTSYQWLNRNIATGTASIAWQDTSPTSTVFSIGDWTPQNYNSVGYIAYCFSEKKGYSKFSSYLGNNNSDGTFVYTGFKPAWVLVKSSGTTDHWRLHDNKRASPATAPLYPHLSNAEPSANFSFDLLSNGFKWRNTDGDANASNTYIYWAFAESPFVNSSGIPTNAR